MSIRERIGYALCPNRTRFLKWVSRPKLGAHTASLEVRRWWRTSERLIYGICTVWHWADTGRRATDMEWFMSERWSLAKYKEQTDE